MAPHGLCPRSGSLVPVLATAPKPPRTWQARQCGRRWGMMCRAKTMASPVWPLMLQETMTRKHHGICLTFRIKRCHHSTRSGLRCNDRCRCSMLSRQQTRPSLPTSLSPLCSVFRRCQGILTILREYLPRPPRTSRRCWAAPIHCWIEAPAHSAAHTLFSLPSLSS